MDLTRLGRGRAKRSRTWAAVCADLFGGTGTARSTETEDEDAR